MAADLINSTPISQKIENEIHPNTRSLANGMMINYNIKRFIANMRKYHNRKKNLPYTELHHQLVDDKSSADN